MNPSLRYFGWKDYEIKHLKYNLNTILKCVQQYKHLKLTKNYLKNVICITYHSEQINFKSPFPMLSKLILENVQDISVNVLFKRTFLESAGSDSRIESAEL